MTASVDTPELRRDRTRAGIVTVAARLLQVEGPGAVTTRSVAAAAGVQPPTIYRLFGDKDGLLDAVVEHVLATYVASKSPPTDGDPVAELRAGWKLHIDFGLANPATFTLMIDPGRGASPAAAAGARVLGQRVHRVAAAGRLRVAELLAVQLLHAAGTGTILTLLALPPEQRDRALADRAWESVAGSIFIDAPATAPGPPVAAAVQLRAALPELEVLSEAERTLMGEWLDRLAATT